MAYSFATYLLIFYEPINSEYAYIAYLEYNI